MTVRDVACCPQTMSIAAAMPGSGSASISVIPEPPSGGRLDYLLIPVAFGFGGPMVALVGTNIGAGQPARALRIALVGGGLAFLLTEAVGIAAAIWPSALLGLFGNDPAMIETGTRYL